MQREESDPPASTIWDGLVDLLVYAPIGLTLDAQDLAPDLARRGRQHTAAARRIGEFAVKAGMRRLDDLVTAIDPSASAATAGQPPTARSTPPTESPVVVAVEPEPQLAAEDAAAAAPQPGSDDPPVEAADLAIPDYDLLAASQVVKRLDALDAEQLDAIRRHEEAGRGRRTILHKITRLQASSHAMIRMDISARTASPDDLAVVTALVREGRADLASQRGGSLWLARQAIPEPLEDALAGRIDADAASVVLGCIDDHPLGVLVCEHDPDPADPKLATVRELFVVGDARGVGLGEAMMETTIQWATDRSCVGIDGYALPGDRATKNFFETFGLVARGIVVHKHLGDASP